MLHRPYICRAAIAARCVLVLVLAGCGGASGGVELGSLLGGAKPVPGEKSEESYVQQVIAFRKEARATPNSARISSDLKRAEEEAGAHYLTAGTHALNQRRFDEAAQLLELGLLAQPGNEAISQARLQALRRREVVRLYDEAERARSVGNADLAQSLLEKANSLDRGNPRIEAALRTLGDQEKRETQRYVIKALDARDVVDLNFRAAKLKDALKVIAEPYAINFVFDPDVETAEVNLSAKRVTFAQGFNLLLQASDTFHKVIGPNSVLIAPNKQDKKDKYADFFIKTFHLQTVKAERMAEILTSSMDLKSVVPNKTLNTVQVRDTRDTLKIVERVISANDRMPAEIMLDVEILEINRSKSEQLGIDYGSQITAQVPQFTVSEALDSLTHNVIGNGLISVPTLQLRYFRDEVEARILAKPRIRTIDGEPAKIHVGDRVPLRSATIQDATGQTRTTFEYRDIGIRLEVLPKYHFDSTISVVLKLEVSSLGQNLGTANEPAFSIGTRNVDTTMMLREGETAVLGGLIRDEERRKLNKVPGFGDIGGVVGRLFAVNDDEDKRTDILLTITPQVLRRQDLPRMGDTDFYSGGKSTFTSQDRFEFLKREAPGDKPPQYRLSPDAGKQEVAVRDAQPAERSPRGGGAWSVEPVAADSQAGGAPRIDFGNDHYSVEQGGVVTVQVKGRNLHGASEMATRILFNPDKLSLDTAAGEKSVGTVQADSSQPGIVDLTIRNIPQGQQQGEFPLATLALRSKAKGLSYLLLNSAGTPKSRDGQAIDVELGSSKIEIR